MHVVDTHCVAFHEFPPCPLRRAIPVPRGERSLVGIGSNHIRLEVTPRNYEIDDEPKCDGEIKRADDCEIDIRTHVQCMSFDLQKRWTRQLQLFAGTFPPA
jgi:hypothetical protein